MYGRLWSEHRGGKGKESRGNQRKLIYWLREKCPNGELSISQLQLHKHTPHCRTLENGNLASYTSTSIDNSPPPIPLRIQTTYTYPLPTPIVLFMFLSCCPPMRCCHCQIALLLCCGVGYDVVMVDGGWWWGSYVDVRVLYLHTGRQAYIQSNTASTTHMSYSSDHYQHHHSKSITATTR